MAKNRQNYQKGYAELREANTSLIRQKGELEIELQKCKFNEEKLMIKHTETEKNLERISSQERAKHKIEE